MSDKWEKLAAPFHPSDIEYRIQALSQNRTEAHVIPFITRTAIQERLNNVLGVSNWIKSFSEWQAPTTEMSAETAKTGSYSEKWDNNQRKMVGDYDPKLAATLVQEHYQKSVKCILSCRLDKDSEWISKEDGASNSDIESTKGGFSDSFKRAASGFGIGSYLNSFKNLWIPCVTGNRPSDGQDWQWARYGRTDVFFLKPDLRNFGAGDPGSAREVIPVTLGNPVPNAQTQSINKQAPTQAQGAPSHGAPTQNAPSAISEPEMKDLLARISTIVQGNKQSLENYRQINDQPDSLNKVSKMLGCLYFVAAQNVPSGQHDSRIKQVMINKNFGEMYSALKDILADMESGVYR